MFSPWKLLPKIATKKIYTVSLGDRAIKYLVDINEAKNKWMFSTVVLICLYLSKYLNLIYHNLNISSVIIKIIFMNWMKFLGTRGLKIKAVLNGAPFGWNISDAVKWRMNWLKVRCWSLHYQNDEVCFSGTHRT